MPNKRKESLGLIDPASKYVKDTEILTPAEAKKARKTYQKRNPDVIKDPPLSWSPIEKFDRRGNRGMTLSTIDNRKNRK